MASVYLTGFFIARYRKWRKKKKKKDTPGALCMFIQDLRTLTLCKQEDVPCWAVDREAQEKSLSFTSFLPKQVDHKKISKTIEKP